MRVVSLPRGTGKGAQVWGRYKPGQMLRPACGPSSDLRGTALPHDLGVTVLPRGPWVPV